jgi:predicted nucleic acid-binding protein
MILLDTNVISETMEPHRERRIENWLDKFAKKDFFLCTPVLAELRQGIELLAYGKMKSALSNAYDRIENEMFSGRILVFDQRAAHHFGRMRARRRTAGKPLRTMDGMIAAIAAAHSMTLATRNVADFEGLDIPLVDPFRETSN